MSCLCLERSERNDKNYERYLQLTGLSRGGLYRHYESTGQIFLEIVNDFSNRQKTEVFTKMEQHIPA